ncbi:MAG: tetratricopeptide repeat protein, partial [Ignavibacteriae bacterium]|nr:tetratricopeptide repeat protein [Ignavibacteriota bacterium]
MKNFKDLFDRLFGWLKIDYTSHHGNEGNKKIVPSENSALDYHYRVGDFIGQKYEVRGVLGKGGFGVVYLVYSHETDSVYALKTFRDEYLEDAQIRERFKKEANVWIDLERHPYLVRAYFVDQFAGRLYIVMEHIVPDEQGLNSLETYLRVRPPDFGQSVRWAIQFCLGMEYAYSRGLRCHRDIKPSNIMVSHDKTIKISDFGLAGVLDSANVLPEIKLNFQKDRVGLSFQTLDGVVGTPTHMSPVQFINAAYCDERSDIYSFGIVLYQMRTGGKVPFITTLPRDNSDEEALRFWNSMRRLHTEAPVPRINSRLKSVICHCLEKKPSNRYQSFNQLRLDLEPLLMRETGEIIKLPEIKELEAWEWVNKGGSLHGLGRFEEAIRCYDRAIEVDPGSSKAWFNKGLSLHDLRRYNEAIHCYEKAIEINSQLAPAWCNKGLSLHSLGRYVEAIHCYDNALNIDSQDATAWNNKGNSLESLHVYEEAIAAYDNALEIDPRYAVAWYNKGISLSNLGRCKESILCYDKALEIDSLNADAWYNKALSEEKLGLIQNAARSYKQIIEMDPSGYE